MKTIRKNSCITVLCIMLFMILSILTGCRKKFWDYNCIWVSEEPYIYMPLDNQYTIVEIDGVIYELGTSWENDGTGIEFCDMNIDGGATEESIIWYTTCKIKNDELYLTVVKDNVSDYEGKTIVLHQQPLEDKDAD